MNPFPYDGVALSEVMLGYVATTVMAPDPTNGGYVPDAAGAYVCRPYDATFTYPIALTLDDVNRDTDSSDLCTPEIKVNVQADDYLNGTDYNAKMRVRGDTSRASPQKSYRVKLGSTSPCASSMAVPCWRGETTLQLNKHPWDLTRIRNKLAMDLMKDLPYMSSLRTQFVHLTYNSGSGTNDYGLFTHVEKLGREFLLNRGWDPNSNVYKAEDFYFAPDPRLVVNADGTAGPDFEAALSVENQAPKPDHTALMAMLESLDDKSVDFATTFNRHFNRNNYLTWFAVNILLGNRDTINRNFGLIQPPGSQTFYFVPWDYDDSLGSEDQPDQIAENRFPDDWALGIGGWWASPLHRRFLQQPGGLSLLVTAVDEIRSAYLTPQKLLALLVRYKPVVQPIVTRTPDLDGLATWKNSALTKAEQWEQEFDRLGSVMDTNYQRFLTRLQNPMPFWQTASVGEGRLDLAWDQSVDLQNDLVSYAVTIAASPDLVAGIVYTGTTSARRLTLPAPTSGTYFMKVVATDSTGHATNAFDRLEIGKTTYLGVLQFEVP